MFYVLATYTTLFTVQGSLLNQGYLGQNGDIDLNNISIVALMTLVVAVIANYIFVRKQSKETRFVRRMGLVFSLIAAAWLMFIGIVIVYLFLSGRILEGL